MQRAIVVRGRLKGPRLIELDEAVEGVEVEVEVVLREAAPAAPEDEGESLIAVMQRKDVVAAMEGNVGVEVLYPRARAGGIGRRGDHGVATGAGAADAERAEDTGGAEGLRERIDGEQRLVS
jgi:hypothetical protein